jgi:hypothetical protein
MSTAAKAVPGLLAGLAGVLAAYLWFNLPGLPWLPVVLLIAAIVVGYGVHRLGVGRIRSDPYGSVPYLEAWSLVILAIGALGAAVVVVLAVLLARLTPDNTPLEQKELLTAGFGACSAFATAAFVKGLDDFGALLAHKIGADFQAELARCYPPPGDGEEASPGYRALYLPESGWGYKARRERAAVFADLPCPQPPNPKAAA